MSRTETLQAAPERADSSSRIERGMESAREISAQSPAELAKALKANPKTREVAQKVLKNPDAYSEDPDVAKIQKQIYDRMGIDVATDANGTLKKLMKGVVDGLVIGNAELLETVNKHGIGFVTEKIAAQFSSLEGIRGILASIGQSVADLWSGDAYKTGKSAAEFVGVTTGLAAVGTVAKFAGKTALKASVKIGTESALHQAASATLRASATALDASGAVLQAPAKVAAKAGEVAWKWTKKAAGALGEATTAVSGSAKLATASGMRNGVRTAGHAVERGSEAVPKPSKAERVRAATELNESLRARAAASGVPEATARAEAFLRDSEIFRGPAVTGKEADAMAERVLRAHEVAKEGERIGAYGFGSLREKLEILTAPGEGRLTSEQAKEAIRKGYAGEVRAAAPRTPDAMRISSEHFSNELARVVSAVDSGLRSADAGALGAAKQRIETVLGIYRDRIGELQKMRSAPGADLASIDAAHRELLGQAQQFRAPYEKAGQALASRSETVRPAGNAAGAVEKASHTEAADAAREAVAAQVRAFAKKHAAVLDRPDVGPHEKIRYAQSGIAELERKFAGAKADFDHYSPHAGMEEWAARARQSMERASAEREFLAGRVETIRGEMRAADESARTAREAIAAEARSAAEKEAARRALQPEIDAIGRSGSLDWKQEFARNTAKERLEKLKEPNVLDRRTGETGFGGPGTDVSADLAAARQIRASLDAEMGKVRERAAELAKKYAGRPEPELAEAVSRMRAHLEAGGGFRSVSQELDARIAAYEKQAALRERFSNTAAEVRQAAASPERRAAEIATLPNLRTQLETARKEFAEAVAPHEKRWQEIQVGRLQVENGLPGKPGEAMSRYGYGPSETPNAYMNDPVLKQLRERVGKLESEVRRVESLADAPA